MELYETFLGEDPEKRKRNRAQLMVWKVSLEQGTRTTPTYAMTDSGAEGVCFVDKNWATSKGFKLELMKKPMPLLNFNGEQDKSATVTHFVVANLKLHDHLDKNAFLFATNLSHYPIILGLPWLKLHDPELKFGKETMLFNSEYCQQNCNTPLRPTRARAVPYIPECNDCTHVVPSVSQDKGSRDLREPRILPLMILEGYDRNRTECGSAGSRKWTIYLRGCSRKIDQVVS